MLEPKRILRPDLRFTKQQIWYALYLSISALAGLTALRVSRPIDFVIPAYDGFIILTGLFGFSIICIYHFTLEKYRFQLSELQTMKVHAQYEHYLRGRVFLPLYRLSIFGVGVLAMLVGMGWSCALLSMSLVYFPLLLLTSAFIAYLFEPTLQVALGKIVLSGSSGGQGITFSGPRFWVRTSPEGQPKCGLNSAYGWVFPAALLLALCLVLYLTVEWSFWTLLIWPLILLVGIVKGSRDRSFRRYHFAEHRVINAYEQGWNTNNLECLRAASMMTRRCGASFLVVPHVVAYVALGVLLLVDIHLCQLHTLSIALVAASSAMVVALWARAMSYSWDPPYPLCCLRVPLEWTLWIAEKIQRTQVMNQLIPNCAKP